MPVPGATSVGLLATALAARIDPSILQWVGSSLDANADVIAWRLSTAPRFLFSVSTHAGQLPDGFYDLQISILDDSLENGEILFLDEVNLVDLCDVTERYDHGEVIER
ncbi:hypothetical protein EP7_001148 [Isosphaeraceae bacterium EP7]